MEYWQQRVIDEASELRTRLGALGRFLETEIFGMIPEREQNLMRAQQGVMVDYLRILDERISLFRFVRRIDRETVRSLPRFQWRVGPTVMQVEVEFHPAFELDCMEEWELPLKMESRNDGSAVFRPSRSDMTWDEFAAACGEFRRLMEVRGWSPIRVSLDYSQNVYPLPESPRSYDWNWHPLKIVCLGCKSTFQFEDLENDYYGDYTIMARKCPGCGMLDCCDVSYEEISDRELEELAAANESRRV